MLVNHINRKKLSGQECLRVLKPLIILCALLLAPALVNSFTSNGSQKTFDFAVSSGKNAEMSSSNFKTFPFIGGVSAVTNSSIYRSELGFLRTLPYLDGESCQNNIECLGNFCCSNICSSSSCPSPSPAVSSTGTGSSGGGGGAAMIEKIYDFTLDKELIKALLKQGGTHKTAFSIKNTGTEELSFKIDASSLSSILLLSDTEFVLAPQSTKLIDVVLFASEGMKPEVYAGNIRINANNITKSLPVILEVQAKKALFDISVQVAPKYKNVLINESVIANITLINVGDLKPVDVQLYYAVKDLDGNNITLGVETLAVYNRISTIKELELPFNISFGTYMFYAKVSYGIETAVAGDIFYVVEQMPPTCFDGVKNQNEEDIDCGGVCSQCTAYFKAFFGRFFAMLMKYKWYILVNLVVLIVVIILVFVFKRKREEKEYQKQLNEKTRKIIAFIDLAIIRGYGSDKIIYLLLSKGLNKGLVEGCLNKVVQRDQKIVEYIDKALSSGHPPHYVKKSLTDVGWHPTKIDRHISEVIRKKLGKRNFH